MNLLVANPAPKLVAAPVDQSFVVDAFENSFSRGIPAETIVLSEGQRFTVSVDPGDLWSNGRLHGWSNANGLDGDLYATGEDKSEMPAGTYIGTDFGPCQLGRFWAPFGALVGKIGGGTLFYVGTSYSGIAVTSGTLRLYYWDENRIGNNQSLTAHIEILPARIPTGFQGAWMTR